MGIWYFQLSPLDLPQKSKIYRTMKLNYFLGYADTKSIEMPLDKIVELIQCNQSVKEQTEKYRYLHRLNDAKDADRVKSGTPCVAVPVRFNSEGKAKKDIVCLTGLSLVDIDHIPEERMDEVIRLVREDPHTLLAYTTISGSGLRILFRIEGLADSPATASKLKHYTAAFNAGNEYYAKLTGCECDLKCKNATRLSGLAHDAEVFYNPNAVPLAYRFFANAQNDKRGVQDDKGKGRKVSPKLLSAIHKELAAQGLAYKAHRHNEYIMRMGYLFNAYGVGLEHATTWALKEFADYDGDVAGILRSCYQQTDEFGTRKLPPSKSNKKDFYASVAEIEAFLDGQARFRHNVVTGKIEYSVSPQRTQRNTENQSNNENPCHPCLTPNDWTEIDDRFVNTLWGRMCKQVKNVHTVDIRAVLHSEFAPLFDPFENYLNGLPPWDGKTDYITELTDTITVKEGEEAFFRKYFKKWLVNLVGSLLEPEVVNHEILVFIGPQGGYKTTWMRYLMPPELRRYFYVKTNSNRVTKDDIISLAEFALICLEELDELDTSTMNQQKALITKPDVNERAAYGHYKERRPHLASFCGTTNHVQFLNDPTGSRRWLPVEVVHIPSPYDHPLDYAGIYSQALALFRSGFEFALSPADIAEVNAHNLEYQVPCTEEELILKLFRIPMDGEQGAVFMTATDILHRINGWVKQLLSTTKIGLAMKKIGYPKVTLKGRSGYRVIELDSEHIMANARALAHFASDF